MHLYYLERDLDAVAQCYKQLDAYALHSPFARNHRAILEAANSIQSRPSMFNTMQVTPWRGNITVVPQIGTPNFNLNYDLIWMDDAFIFVSKKFRDACEFSSNEADYIDVQYASTHQEFIDKDYKLIQVLNVEQPLDLEASRVVLRYPAEEMRAQFSQFPGIADCAARDAIEALIVKHGEKIIRSDFAPTSRIFWDKFSQRVCVTDDIYRRLKAAHLLGLSLLDFREITSENAVMKMWPETS